MTSRQPRENLRWCQLSNKAARVSEISVWLKFTRETNYLIYFDLIDWFLYLSWFLSCLNCCYFSLCEGKKESKKNREKQRKRERESESCAVNDVCSLYHSFLFRLVASVVDQSRWKSTLDTRPLVRVSISLSLSLFIVVFNSLEIVFGVKFIEPKAVCFSADGSFFGLSLKLLCYGIQYIKWDCFLEKGEKKKEKEKEKNERSIPTRTRWVNLDNGLAYCCLLKCETVDDSLVDSLKSLFIGSPEFAKMPTDELEDGVSGINNWEDGVTFESIVLRRDRWAPFIGWSRSQSLSQSSMTSPLSFQSN